MLTTIQQLVHAADENADRRADLGAMTEGEIPSGDLADIDEMRADAGEEAVNILDALVTLLKRSGVTVPWIDSDEYDDALVAWGESYREDAEHARESYDTAKTEYLDKIENVLHFNAPTKED